MKISSILRSILIPRHRRRSFAFALLLSMLPACGNDEPKGPGPNEGTVSIDFVVPGGTGNLTQVNYVVLQNGNPLVPAKQDQILLGSATSTTKPNVSIFLPTGTGYTISMTATTTTSIACSGVSASFSITTGGSTAVALNLVCGGGGPMPGGGEANVTTTVGGGDSCPVLTYYSANPTSVKVGDQVLLGATATDPNVGDTLSYQWSAPSGTFTTPTSNNATFVCASTGTVAVTLSYVDVTTLLSPCAPQTVITQITCM